MNAQLLDRVPVINRFAGENHTTKILVWRRRGDIYQPELHDATRFRYEDRPNAYVLDSGEEIPAIPLKNVYTMTDGTPFLEVVEVDDGQYAPKDNLLSKEGEEGDLDFETLEEQYNIEVEQITEEAKTRLENLFEGNTPQKKGRQTEKVSVPLKRSLNSATIDDKVIQNKDTRLNFWLDHLKESQDKYGIGGWIKEHMNIILIVVTALAIGILFYTSPISADAFLQLMNDLVTEMQTMNSNLETLRQSGALGQ